MATSIHEISELFSRGLFKSVYTHFADNIKWNLVGASVISGKIKVIEHCDKMLADMAGAEMTNTNKIIADDKVVIQGHCGYTGPDNTPGKVEYCDIYRFDNEKLVEITSYIIEISL